MVSRKIVTRFLSVGVVNTALGYAVIFACMFAGLNPIVSNAVGYATGLSASFILSKFWVFQSPGRGRHEASRYIVAFGVAYIANVSALWLALQSGACPPIAQIVGGGAYVFTMLWASARWVFR